MPLFVRKEKTKSKIQQIPSNKTQNFNHTAQMNSKLQCSQHQSNYCEFIHLNPNNLTSNLLLCSACVAESKGSIKLIDCLSIQQLYSSNPPLNLSKYPPLNNTTLNQLLSGFSSSIDKEINETQHFFKVFLINSREVINALLNKTKKQVENLQQVRNKLLEKYYEIIQIDQLKLIISSVELDQETQLRRFIQNKQNEATQLMVEINQITYHRDCFGAEQPQKILNNILKEIQSIEFFNNKQLIEQQQQLQNSLVNNTESVSILSTVSFLSSNKLDPLQNRFPTIERLNNQQIKMIGVDVSQQCFLEEHLDPQKNYIIRIQTKINPNDIDPIFCFGLMPYSMRYDRKLENQRMCYNESADCYGMTKMRKGTKLHLGEDYSIDDSNYWKFNYSRRFEVRINISQQLLRIGSFPDYSVVVEINDKNKIDKTQNYTFAIRLFSDNQVLIEDIRVASKFDQNM